MLNKKILNHSESVVDIYEAQCRAFSKLEYQFLNEIITKHNIRSILDVGTGEGSFIYGLAQTNPGIAIKAVDGDPNLIGKATSKYNLANLQFESALFDHNYSRIGVDLILARFSVEHMSDIASFTKASFERLKSNGLLVVTEYLCEYHDLDDDIWKLFRSKEIELYEKFGSKPYTPLFLPRAFNTIGFKNIGSLFHHITPSTIGSQEFYNTVYNYTISYSEIEPTVFTSSVRNRIVEYCNNLGNANLISEDRLLVSHTIGIKP